MAFWSEIGSAVSDIGNGISNVWDRFRNGETNVLNKQIAEQNLAFQQQNYEYQKALQQQIFEREDSAYERTANDMRNAGLSPLSMQGTNAAGQPIQTDGLHNDYQHSDLGNLNALATVAQTLSSLAYNSAEIDKLRSESRKADAEANNITFGNKINELFGMDAAKFKHNEMARNDKLMRADVAYQLFNGILPSMTNEQKNMASIVQALDMDNSDIFKSFGFFNQDGNQKQTDMQNQASNIGALMLFNGFADLFKGLIPNINLSGISKRLNIIGDKK